jgi:hypothetical protein
MKTQIRYTILLVLVFAGCSVEPKVMNTENVTQIIKFGDQYFLTLTDKPLSETIKPIENTHAKGQMDEWHTARYENAMVAYYRVVPDKRNILSRLELTSEKVTLPFGLHVGVSQSTVVRTLGKPTNIKDGLLEYTFEDPYAQTVAFKINNGMVQMITWIFEID